MVCHIRRTCPPSRKHEILASLHKVRIHKTVKQMQSRLEELETMLDVDKQKERFDII